MLYFTVNEFESNQKKMINVSLSHERTTIYSVNPIRSSGPNAISCQITFIKFKEVPPWTKTSSFCRSLFQKTGTQFTFVHRTFSLCSLTTKIISQPHIVKLNQE